MKAGIVCSFAFIWFVLACGWACGQAPAEVRVVGEPMVNVGLAGVEEIYVRVMPDSATEIDSGGLETEIGKKLAENGLKVVSADISDVNDQQKQKMAEVLERRGVSARNLRVYSVTVPEVIVRVSVLRGEGSGPCVYHVQTSFATEVSLRRPRARQKAEIWRIDVPIGIADANECEAAVRAAAMGQVDAFIAEWKKANEQKGSADAEKPATDAATSSSAKWNKEGGQGQKIEYEYVASKNSKVFHKAGCRAAARISSENLIGFSSREEAINSGRRPCKMCKP